MLRVLINFLVSLLLFPINIFILLNNYNNIIKSKKIVIQTEGGFGHCLTIQLCSKLKFKKNFLYISFLESNRHNKYLPVYMNLQYIIFRNNLSFKYKNKNFTIGEKEHSNFKIFEKILIKLISIINNSKIFYDQDIYKYIEKKHHYDEKENVPALYRWEQIIINLLHKQKIFLKNKKLKDILINNNLDEFLKFEKNKNKNVSIYLRNRSNKDSFSSMRNGSYKRDYIPTFEYLVKKNYNLFVFGDKIFNERDLKKFNGRIIDCNNFKKKKNELLQLYFLSISKVFISEAGGAQYFAPFFKKFILINSYPPKLQFYNCYELQKKIFDKKKNIFLNKNQIKRLFWWNNLKINKRFILQSNKGIEIKKFIKKIIY